MIPNNNIKKFIEVSKSNIDRLIISSHFDSHLTLNQIIRNIEVAYDTEISTDYISQIINKHTIIMAALNKKANHIAAPLIQHISSDELYCRKYAAKKGVLYSTHDVHSSYTINSYYNPHRNAATRHDWNHAISYLQNNGLQPETMNTDLGSAIYHTHKLYKNCYHFADGWHTIDKIQKIKNGITREVTKARNAINATQRQFQQFIDPKTTEKARQKILNSFNNTTYTNTQLKQLEKALLHVNICIDLFYSHILKPSIMTPHKINTNYDTIIAFIEEVQPYYPTETFNETIGFLKRNKDKILAFTHYLQNKFTESYPPFKKQGVSFNDFWITISQKQYSKKNKIRQGTMQKLSNKYGTELFNQMCSATNQILAKLKLTTQVTEGFHAKIAQYCQNQKELSQIKFDAYNFHLNHLKMHSPKCKSRKGKSRFEVCTGIKNDDWLDMVMGHKINVFRCYVNAAHKKQDILNQRFAA